MRTLPNGFDACRAVHSKRRLLIFHCPSSVVRNSFRLVCAISPFIFGRNLSATVISAYMPYADFVLLNANKLQEFSCWQFGGSTHRWETEKKKLRRNSRSRCTENETVPMNGILHRCAHAHCELNAIEENTSTQYLRFFVISLNFKVQFKSLFMYMYGMHFHFFSLLGPFVLRRF